jgi:hypothetical protein
VPTVAGAIAISKENIVIVQAAMQYRIAVSSARKRTGPNTRKLASWLHVEIVENLKQSRPFAIVHTVGKYFIVEENVRSQTGQTIRISARKRRRAYAKALSIQSYRLEFD